MKTNKDTTKISKFLKDEFGTEYSYGEKYWFRHMPHCISAKVGQYEQYEVLQRDDNSDKISYRPTGNTIFYTKINKEEPTEVEAALYRFLTRPEGYLCKEIVLSHRRYENIKKQYECRLIACALVRAEQNGVNPDSEQVWKAISNFITWLRETDFFNAPASTKFHDAEPHGLLYHSCKVFNKTLELLRIPSFYNIPFNSAALVSLTHDWGKIGVYIPYKRNIMDDTSGQWTEITAYKRVPNPNGLGDGTASAYLVMKYFKLTDIEFAAIRWHQGAWSCHITEQSTLSNCNNKYATVLLLQFAEQLACTEYSNATEGTK